MDKVYWTTKCGEKIDVDDMDINHLRNTLKMIIRQANCKGRPYRFSLNGDIAQSSIDDAVTDAMIDELDEFYLFDLDNP